MQLRLGRPILPTWLRQLTPSLRHRESRLERYRPRLSYPIRQQLRGKLPKFNRSGPNSFAACVRCASCNDSAGNCVVSDCSSERRVFRRHALKAGEPVGSFNCYWRMS